MKFIEFLDNYKNKQNIKYIEYAILLDCINNDFLDNTDFCANVNIETDNTNNYYSLYSSSNWNYNNDNNQNYDISNSSFSIWQNKHEYNINPILEKIIIDVDIKNIDDLLTIINKYDYDINKEYNIDLKSLHSIKDDLIKLNNMVGMTSLKKSILDQMIYFMLGLHKCVNNSEFKHTVLCGPPGTGKTEVAKIIGVMYSKLGILNNNIFKKVTRSDLVAGYLGQTAIKTKNVINECLGGVLFIDEAYSLASYNENDIYSKECIDTICEALSDNKDNLMVIIAGYEDELDNTFFKANRGLESRFIWRFQIDKYSPLELMNIFKKKVHETDWVFQDETIMNEKWFIGKKDNFLNYGRDMELLLSYTKISHGRRIYGKNIELIKKISIDDLNKGYDTFLNNKLKKNKPNFMHSIYI